MNCYEIVIGTAHIYETGESRAARWEGSLNGEPIASRGVVEIYLPIDSPVPVCAELQLPMDDPPSSYNPVYRLGIKKWVDDVVVAECTSHGSGSAEDPRYHCCYPDDCVETEDGNASPIDDLQRATRGL